jgi:hypothetical protein
VPLPHGMGGNGCRIEPAGEEDDGLHEATVAGGWAC